VKVAAHANSVRHRFDQRTGTPNVVEACREDGEPVRPVTVEVVLEELADSLEVGFQADALIVRQAAVGGTVAPLRIREKRVETRVGISRGGRQARIEVDEEADRAALLGAELRELSQRVPVHCLGHTHTFFPGERRF
jgi:hypothetical protein